jgi:hypothetical protein
MSRSLQEILNDLDGAARANLNARGVAEYETYKKRLIADGHEAGEIEEILSGFIWDASEGGSDLARD